MSALYGGTTAVANALLKPAAKTASQISGRAKADNSLPRWRTNFVISRAVTARSARSTWIGRIEFARLPRAATGPSPWIQSIAHFAFARECAWAGRLRRRPNGVDLRCAVAHSKARSRQRARREPGNDHERARAGVDPRQRGQDLRRNSRRRRG